MLIRTRMLWLVPTLAIMLIPTLGLAQTQSVSAEPLLDYHNMSDYLPQTPSTTGGAAAVFGNPAAWTTGDRTEFAFWWDSRNLRDNALDNWGLSFGKHLGFAVNSGVFWADNATRRVNDYQMGLALGGRSSSFGLAYRWATGDKEYLDRQNAWLFGFIGRPSPYFCLGASGTFATRTSAALGFADVGIRPFGDDRLTFFGDYYLRDGEKLTEGRWGAGVNLRPISGLHLGVKFRDADLVDEDKYRTTFSVGVILGQASFDVLPQYTKDGDFTHTAFLFRINPSLRPLPIDPTPFSKAPRYAVISLENKRLTYQSYRWWDKKRVAWLDLARYLDAIGEDSDLDGIVLNLSGLSVRPSIAWELRQKLLELQADGKEIFIHADGLGMVTYYLASVADNLSLDPQAAIMVPGVALRRTFLKGTLEKVGIGFQEFRYFTYKSAAEMFSRDSMSAPDREQRERVVDVIYDALRTGVCDGRALDHAQYDAVIDDAVVLTAVRAKQHGLVDRIGRWEVMGEWLEEHNGGKLVSGPHTRYLRDYRETIWGSLPKIAVVYAVGECAMDSGIKGRATSKHLQQLARDPQVIAVVLRADSPGGSPLPSDLVADGIKKLKESGKPVIVSQGDVAASGGYWISMDGSRILTTPLTITGSIGVIGGWVWDDGLGEKLGMTADSIQRGKHADLFASMSFPFLGGSIPRRPLDDEELGMVKDLILELYDDFVSRVAAGREIDEEKVREIGEGRVWMGGDAIDNGLCDEFGSLQDAIALAREMAGIAAKQPINIEEFPKRPLFAPPFFGSSIPGLAGLISPLVEPMMAFAREIEIGPGEGNGAGADDEEEWDYDTYYLQSLVGNAGSPVLVTPPEALPAAWTGGMR